MCLIVYEQIIVIFNLKFLLINEENLKMNKVNKKRLRQFVPIIKYNLLNINKKLKLSLKLQFVNLI